MDPVPGLIATDPDVIFALGIGIGACAGFGWGWHHWGADWHGHRVVYNQSTYLPHHFASADRPNIYGPPSMIGHADGFHDRGSQSQLGMHYGVYHGLAMLVPPAPLPFTADQASVEASISPEVPRRRFPQWWCPAVGSMAAATDNANAFAA